MVTSTAAQRHQIFNLLIIFRWLSLLPALPLVLSAFTLADFRALSIFAAALLLTTAITIFAQTLNDLLKKWPWLLAVDLFLAALLIMVSGGSSSPYYLYGLSPLLAAAFFFQLPGALIATTLFTLFYLAALALSRNYFNAPPSSPAIILIAVAGSYLISIALGYASFLLNQLQRSKDHLARANKDFAVLHQLSTALQRSANAQDVQDQVLSAITRNLNFPRAVIAMVDAQQNNLAFWRAQNREQPHARALEMAALPLSSMHDTLVSALLANEVKRVVIPSLADQPGALSQLAVQDALILPLVYGSQPVGLIVVELRGKDRQAAQLNPLTAITRQTAVTLGMMLTRRRRAHDSAIAEERTRIALDLHDTTSQSLFGLVYTLEACINLLPQNPQVVKPELQNALQTAQEVRRRIRATINDMWPEELTAQKFESDLRRYADNILQASAIDFTFEIEGDFSTLSPAVRRGIYRICQEGIANIVQHAAATESRVCVDVNQGRARFVLRDNGQGFSLQEINDRPAADSHFGLRGMRERAAALGGTCQVYSKPAQGTSIIIDLPANTQPHHSPSLPEQDEEDS